MLFMASSTPISSQEEKSVTGLPADASSAMSIPEQKALSPAPLMITVRTCSFLFMARMISVNSFHMASVNELRLSGRLMVILHTLSCSSTIKRSSGMGSLPDRSSASFGGVEVSGNNGNRAAHTLSHRRQ